MCTQRWALFSFRIQCGTSLYFCPKDFHDYNKFSFGRTSSLDLWLLSKFWHLLFLCTYDLLSLTFNDKQISLNCTNYTFTKFLSAKYLTRPGSEVIRQTLNEFERIEPITKISIALDQVNHGFKFQSILIDLGKLRKSFDNLLKTIFPLQQKPVQPQKCSKVTKSITIQNEQQTIKKLKCWIYF